MKRINIYTCNCGNKIITADVSPGVTPFMIHCIKCDGDAKSCFYDLKNEKEAIEKLVVDYEWFRPDNIKDYDFFVKGQGSVEHFKNGGLFLRKRTVKEVLDYTPSFEQIALDVQNTKVIVFDSFIKNEQRNGRIVKEKKRSNLLKRKHLGG